MSNKAVDPFEDESISSTEEEMEYVEDSELMDQDSGSEPSQQDDLASGWVYYLQKVEQTPSTPKKKNVGTNFSNPSGEPGINAICKFRTIHGFWKCFNSLQSASVIPNLQYKDSVHLFRENIKPEWEDESNKYGGEIVFKCSEKDSPLLWQETTMAIVGEQLADVLEDNDIICGITISKRLKAYVFQIWNKKAFQSDTEHEKILNRLMGKIREAKLDIPIDGAYYKKHSEYLQKISIK